jgi:ATP-dependent DNA helicase Rep
MLVGVTEGMLPFKLGDDASPIGKSDGQSQKPDRDHGPMSDSVLERLQEERRLMYVGITRAQRSLAVSWTRKRKKGREMIPALPSRFIAEMGLDKTTVREDPREKLKALRAEFAKKTADAEALAASEKMR